MKKQRLAGQEGKPGDSPQTPLVLESHREGSSHLLQRRKD